MFDKLKAAEERFLYLEEKLASPDVAQNQEEFTKIMKEYKNLTPIIEKYREQKIGIEEALKNVKEKL